MVCCICNSALKAQCLYVKCSSPHKLPTWTTSQQCESKEVQAQSDASEWNAFLTKELDGDENSPRSDPNVVTKRTILPVVRTEPQ